MSIALFVAVAIAFVGGLLLGWALGWSPDPLPFIVITYWFYAYLLFFQYDPVYAWMLPAMLLSAVFFAGWGIGALRENRKRNCWTHERRARLIASIRRNCRMDGNLKHQIVESLRTMHENEPCPAEILEGLEKYGITVNRITWKTACMAFVMLTYVLLSAAVVFVRVV